jgi:hypothetical protein
MYVLKSYLNKVVILIIMKKKLLILLVVLVFIIGCGETEPIIEEASEVSSEIPAIITDEAVEGSDTIVDSNVPVLGEEPVDEMIVEVVEETIIETESENDASLIAHWTFDSDGNDATNNYHGILKGGAKIQEGKINKAIYLDGIDDYVEFPQTALDNVGSLSQGTISFWFNYESLLDKQTVMPIFYIGNKQGSPDNMYVIEIGHSEGDGRTDNPDPSDKKIYSTWIKNNREPFLCFDSGKNMAEKTWHHYTVVVGPDGNQGYINGILMENTDHNFGNSNAQSFLDSFEGKETFLLGYGRSSFMISPEFVYYKGLIDDLRIYDKPLEWIEVQELYTMGK